ncbi:MAG: DNA-binding transcriptional regulator [Verrucomicrobiota bacterium]
MNELHDRDKPTIALLIETSRAYGRSLCLGIAEYARAHGEWYFVVEQRDLRSGVSDWLSNWKGDGVIGRIYNPELAETLASLDCPVIDTYGQARHPGIPYLDTDAVAVAELAARFFIDATFSNFAFCGFPGLWFSDERSKAFTEILKNFGTMPAIYSPPQSWSSGDVARREALHPDGSPELAAWVESLPAHTAILACNDTRAQQLLSVAARIGRQVPEDLAVMGVDNDELICELTNPRLTSIQPDARTLGYTAAHWLDLLLQGRKLNYHHLLIPPVRIHERASTDIIASDDPDFIRALRFIRSQVQTGLNAEAVVSDSKLSRSSLENRFKDKLGRSIKEEITRSRIARSIILLRETSMTLQQVAEASGFATSSHFSRIFKATEGITPGAFRTTPSEGA